MTTLYLSTRLPLRLLVLAASFTAAQNTTPTSTSTSDDVPAHTDNAGGGSNNDNRRDTVGMVNYYFVFLALVVCVAGVAAYLMYKRKQKYGTFLRHSQGNALERDVGSYDATRARRRYWQGRWRSTDHGREEGLNEYGEAPPPYMPKTTEEESNPNGLTVPMQTLSRDEAGLNKPPEYAQANARPVDPEIHVSGAGASHSLHPQPSHIHQRFAP